MGLPKRKFSRSRRNKRRTHTMKRQAPARSRCARCGHVNLPHRVCDNCGHYAGRQVIEVEGA